MLPTATAIQRWRLANGNILEGEFADGKIHGHAVFKYPNGDQREGVFSENVLDGQVIYTRANGRIVIGNMQLTYFGI